MTKKLLILGANGMLGSSLHRYFSRQTDLQVVGTVRSAQSKRQLAVMGFHNTISGIDAMNERGLDKVIAQERPDYVFNCVGLIKQLSVSKEPLSAIEINSLLPHRLAQLCRQYGGKLIHFSTDCVFSGKNGNYVEHDIPDADDIYGRSKLLGEVGYDGHLTLRTSIIGHELGSNLSLIDWFLSQNEVVKGFTNAIFSGMPTCYVAEFIHRFVLPNFGFSGIYHLSAPPIDKYSLLSMVKEIYGIDTKLSKYDDFRIDRSLNSDALRSALNFLPAEWPELIKKMNAEYTEYFCKNE